MNYKESIEKEAIQQLPSTLYQGPIIIVDKREQVEDAIRELEKYDILGIDTETKPSFAKGQMNNVCLVQISAEDKCFLFRLNSIGFPKALRGLLESEKVIKIGLSLLDDLRGLKRLGEFTPKGFVDLQNFVEEYGILDKSLKKIAAIVLDSRISKKQRLTNWESQTLTEPQLRYAATDAWVCLVIYNKLMTQN